MSSKRRSRIIFHIDMNAFYCSVHEAVEPERYRGRAIAVAGSVELRRGIVVTSSYAARRQGVRTGMQVRQAMRLCPELQLISPDFNLYRQYSQAFMRIISQYSPLVESFSIDECYVDMTGSSQFGPPLEVARTIQQRIAQECGLPCSIGVGPNKLLAKMASDMKKPNGLTVLRIRDVPHLLWHKPCQELYGIGKRTADKLKRRGVETIGQLAKADEAKLRSWFGINGPALKRSANGRDESPVNPNREPNKSIGHTTTLPFNYTDRGDIAQVFLNLADQVCRRLRRQRLVAGAMHITIRDPDMRTITRSHTFDHAVEEAREVHQLACQLFDKHWAADRPVRLLGITLQQLTSKESTAVQLDLFDYEAQSRRERLTEAMDGIRDKFGESSLLTAGMLTDDPSSLIRDHRRRGTSLQKREINLQEQGE